MNNREKKKRDWLKKKLSDKEREAILRRFKKKWQKGLKKKR
jgi:hypothetical protein